MQLIDYSKVKINNGFWKEKYDMVKNKTVYAVYDRFKDTYRFEALTCSWKEGDPYEPHIFWDSDVAKWIEGVAYLLKFERNEKLEQIVDEAVDNITKNADEFGYYNSRYLIIKKDYRFKDRNCHELYCAGHLIEAAVAYYEATGKDKFLKAMRKYADYIEKVFKTEDSAAFTTPGHPELELALVRLYNTTGEKRYLELSKYFIDMHGNNDKDKPVTNWATTNYNMDETSLREALEPRGHAVRAMYLLCGMADIAEIYGDTELADACRRCFDSTVDKRMYITGGIGSTHSGEAFTVDYHLPNATAYAETCASISLAMFALRMQKLDNKAKYADAVERALYNNVLSGISMSGDKFFYENPLEIDLDFRNVHVSTNTKVHNAITERVAVFDCSCCPPNLVRFLSSIGGYFYGYDDDTVFINQFADSAVDTDGIKIEVETEYPKNGKLKITAETDKLKLAVRKPQWCENVTASRDYELKDGYMYFDLSRRTEIEIEFDMPVTVVRSNPKVHENAGKVAVTRGPVVYCAESVDNGYDLNNVKIDIKGNYELGDSEFMLPDIKTTAYLEAETDCLYSKATDEFKSADLKLIPYYAFANRGTSNMKVWLLKK